MNIDHAKKILIDAIKETLEENINVTDNMQLIGSNALLDSMKLVELCLALEDLADENGFEFDWTSDSAMSKSQSMFRTVSSLAEEFAAQSEK